MKKFHSNLSFSLIKKSSYFSKFRFSSMITQYQLENDKLVKYEYKTKSELQSNNITSIGDILEKKYDYIIIGAGHNGLTCANYLANSGKKVLILEKRHIVGGAAVTEEIVKGYKFSRCSYVLSLFRGKIIEEILPNFRKDVNLIKRSVGNLTLTDEPGRYILASERNGIYENTLSKFSPTDYKNLSEYNNYIERMSQVIRPLIDFQPFDKIRLFDRRVIKLAKHLLSKRKDLIDTFYFLTATTENILNKYFTGDLIRAAIATDAVIGAYTSPKLSGSSYVLVHHTMGTLDKDGSWYYVEGGMGSVSKYLEKEALKKGVDIITCADVKTIHTQENKITGLSAIIDNREFKINSNGVISNANVNYTMLKLDNKSFIPESIKKSIDQIVYDSPQIKINLLMKSLPRFISLKQEYEKYSNFDDFAKNYMTGTIHINCTSLNQLDECYNYSTMNLLHPKPLIEMTIPSILDKTLIPEGSNYHVASLFCQYIPKNNSDNRYWNEEKKNEFVDIIIDSIEKYAPGFKNTILFKDVLGPRELENEFSLKGGNIFHGEIGLSNLFVFRPVKGMSEYRNPFYEGLFFCGSAMHPGGGVSGAPGRNCANAILNKF